MRAYTHLVLALLAVTPLGVTAGQVYRSVAPDGSVQYSERPPPGANAEVVPLPHAAPMSPAQSADELKRLREKAGLGAAGGQPAAAAPAVAPPTPEQQAERERQRAENCRTAQENARVLETAQRVMGKDAQGNEVRLDDTQKQARLEETRRQIEQFCGPGK